MSCITPDNRIPSFFWLPLVASIALALYARPSAAADAIELDSPIPAKGTLSFQLHTAEAWQNGAGAECKSAPFVKIPGIAEGSLSQTVPAVGVHWKWIGGHTLRCLVPELPAGETWFFQVTWDSAAGKYDVFVNGAPITTPGIAYQPWRIAVDVTKIESFGNPLAVSDVQLGDGYLSPQAAEEKTPHDLRGKHWDLYGNAKMPPPLAVEKRKGKVLENNPLGEASDVKAWGLEGPAKVDFADGWMQMRSTRPDASGGVNGHIVHWCPRDFPASFVCEWDVQIVSDFGLTIVFFAAKGENGEDIFDASLPSRDGTFVHYIRGAVKSYHISYFASTPGTPGRATSNLRKNNSFYLASTGPVAVPDDSRSVHQMRLFKDGAHIQLQVDGRVSIDYTDPGTDRYGPVYEGGKIGLRQMQWTVGRYRNFRVWELLPGEKAN